MPHLDFESSWNIVGHFEHFQAQLGTVVSWVFAMFCMVDEHECNMMNWCPLVNLCWGHVGHFQQEVHGEWNRDVHAVLWSHFDRSHSSMELRQRPEMEHSSWMFELCWWFRCGKFGTGSEGHSSLGAGDNEPICPDWLLGRWGQLPLAPWMYCLLFPCRSSSDKNPEPLQFWWHFVTFFFWGGIILQSFCTLFLIFDAFQVLLAEGLGESGSTWHDAIWEVTTLVGSDGFHCAYFGLLQLQCCVQDVITCHHVDTLGITCHLLEFDSQRPSEAFKYVDASATCPPWPEPSEPHTETPEAARQHSMCKFREISRNLWWNRGFKWFHEVSCMVSWQYLRQNALPLLQFVSGIGTLSLCSQPWLLGAAWW